MNLYRYEDELKKLRKERDDFKAECERLQDELNRLSSNDADLAVEMINRLVKEGGAIISSNDASILEIAFARAENRFYVDSDGFGYIIRYRKWLHNADKILLNYAPKYIEDEKEEKHGC